MLGDTYSSDLHQIRSFLANSFGGRILPLVFRHGDYSLENVLFDRNWQVQGVIDWDLAQPEGVPGLDVLYFSSLASAVKSGGTWIPKLFELGSMTASSSDVQQYFRTMRISPDLFFPLALITYFDHIANRLGNSQACCLFNIGQFTKLAVQRIQRERNMG